MSKYQKTASYHKLVRDKIPEIIEEKDDLEVITKVLGKEETIIELKKKIIEEASEFNEAKNKDEIIIELADLREVELALQNELGIENETVEKIREERHEKRGGFERRIFLIETKEKK